MYQYVLFDLDGTITDPGMGITNAVAYTYEKYGIAVPPRQELYRYIGPPLKDCFAQFCGFSDEEATRAVSVYREYYGDKGLYENEVYEGMEELLKQLRADGKILLTATSKPEPFAVKILEHYGLAKYFDFIGGATFDPSRSKKGDVIAYVLKKWGITDLSKAVMIGDRKHDVIGAKENGLDSIGVLYGYGNLEEMQEAGATYIAQTVADILPLI